MEQLHTIGQVLKLIEKSYQNPVALATYENNQWVKLSTAQFIEEVKYLALALISMGVKKGDKVGIVSPPGNRWTIADFAIMASGAVSVPMFANLSEENFVFEITQTDMKVILVGGKEPWKRCEKYRSQFDTLISLDDVPEINDAIAYNRIMEMGRKFDQENPHFYSQQLDSLKPEDLATIIYTSGSTGVPKGAEHTQYSFSSLLHNEVFHWNWKTDSYLSFLPVAHVLARIVNVLLVTWGVSVYYYNDIKNLGFAFKDVKPTIAIVVPRLLEKIYVSMVTKIQQATGLKRKLGLWAIELANQDNHGFLYPIQHFFAEKLVYHKLREALGGRLRVIISGGAPLNAKLCKFYQEIGFPIYEGYGLTEACPVCVNRIGKSKPGSVGLPIDGMNVKLTNEGELLVKGTMEMTCYYKNPEQTKNAIDEEGWLHTGDKASIDSDGYISIIGRMKELMKTSTGEMIAPIPIEQALTKAFFIDLAMVVAENKKFVSCLLVPDFDALQNIKKKNHLEHIRDEDFLNSHAMKQEVNKLLSQVNEHLNHWEKVRDYRFIPHSLSIETGELTPSMKIRRDAIEKKYKDLIDSMYVETN